jgi:hypothetical protein
MKVAFDRILLKKHVDDYLARIKRESETHAKTARDRRERVVYYQSWTAERLRAMTAEDLLEYLSKLWAMLIWGNKQYVIDKLIEDHGLETVREEIAHLVWGGTSIETRWDRFRSRIKGVGPAMMSEMLAHVHPDDFVLWNRRAYVGMHYLGIPGLPRHNYQVNGKKYRELCEIGKTLAAELRTLGVKDADLLTVDYFIWEELQVEDNLSRIGQKESPQELAKEVAQADDRTAEFIHDEVKQKLADIGKWYGFASRTEVKVAAGSVVDTIWESTIGNMGRVIYVFEVQTKGSIDSLLMNLLKALNNAAVQGVVAVSDAEQIEKIRKHAADVGVLREKLRYWDYTDVLATHAALEQVNESINRLDLVPQGFVTGK